MKSDKEVLARILAASAINHVRAVLRRTGINPGSIDDATLMHRWLARIEEGVDSGIQPTSPEVKPGPCPTECWLVVSRPGSAKKACGEPPIFFLVESEADDWQEGMDPITDWTVERWLLTPSEEELVTQTGVQAFDPTDDEAMLDAHLELAVRVTALERLAGDDAQPRKAGDES